MFHCLPKFIETIKHRFFSLSPYLGHNLGVAKMLPVFGPARFYCFCFWAKHPHRGGAAWWVLKMLYILESVLGPRIKLIVQRGGGGQDEKWSLVPPSFFKNHMLLVFGPA